MWMNERQVQQRGKLHDIYGGWDMNVDERETYG